MAYAFHGLRNEGMMDIFGYLESCKFRYHLNHADFWSGFFPTTDQDFVLKIKEALAEKDLDLVDIAVDQADVWDKYAEVGIQVAMVRDVLEKLRLG